MAAPGSRAGEVQLDRSVPALILKVGHYPLSHGGLGAIRSLGRAGVPVYGVSEDRRAPTAVSRYLTGRFVWPNAGQDQAALLEGMAGIAERIGRPAVLLPTDDDAAVLVAEHADALAGRFLFAAQPPALPRTVGGKLGLYRTCTELGVPCPEAVVPASAAELAAFCDRAAFPVVAKAADSAVVWRAGVHSTQIVHTPEELRTLWTTVERACGGGRLLLQEHIPDGEDWIVHGYCDERSDCLVGFTGVKLRSYPPYAGPTTLGRCQANAALLDQAAALFRRLGYRGIMDMDWRLDRRDGRYKLLDFNPRLGAQFRLFVNEHGVDVARALHLDLTGRAVPRGGAPDGRAFMVETHDTLAAIGYRRRGALTLPGWLRSLRGVRELAWFARDDLLPVASFGARFLRRGADKALRRPARPPTGTGPPVFLPGRTRPRAGATRSPAAS
ncbi:MAG TPA: hypothetical protein VKG45_04170 [Actinomycetes bacterium]|nr:hypothetical protein [Actinomycetes bacterium]